MSTRADLSLYDPLDRLIAVVEVKKRVLTTASWAREFRRNLLEFSGFSQADYVLLITPDKLYLWGHGDPPEAEPRFEIDLQPILAPYFEKARLKPSEISGHAFELIVASWLADLSYGAFVADAPPLPAALRESGFLDAIRSGRLEHEIAA